MLISPVKEYLIWRIYGLTINRTMSAHNSRKNKENFKGGKERGGKPLGEGFGERA